MNQNSTKTVEEIALQLGISKIRRDVICRKEGLKLETKTTDKKFNNLYKKYFGKEAIKL